MESSAHIVHFIGLLFCSWVNCAYSTSSSTVFPDRSALPGLKSPFKVWWSKELTPELHVAGRLTERQIKYAGEAGFRSILSLFTYQDDEAGDFGGNYLPTTKEAKEIVENVAGLQFMTLLDSDDKWTSVEAVRKLTAAIPNLKKPVLLYSNRGRSITFVTLMYLANQTHFSPDFTPRIKSEDFYNIAASMGFDFTMDETKNVVAEITGEPIVENPPVSETEPKEWFDYWLVQPVYKNWHIAGQILKSHISVIEKAHFKVVINLRPGLTFRGEPSQEEITLLNIKQMTGTYATEEKQARQSPERLEETRIDPNKPNWYISKDSPVNYEISNPEEFGDEVGYNEAVEAEAFKTSSLKYLHFPKVLNESIYPYEEFFEEYMEKLLEAGRQGPVNLHCLKAFRATYIGVLAAALQHGKDMDWALRRTRELGYPVTEEKTPNMFAIYKDWFGRRRHQDKKSKEEL